MPSGRAGRSVLDAAGIEGPAGNGRKGDEGIEGGSVLKRLAYRMQLELMEIPSRLRSEGGVIATEYIIVLVLVALAVIAGATYLGIQVNGKLSEAGNLVRDCVPASC